MSYLYLASPYTAHSGDHNSIMLHRFQEAVDATHYLLNNRIWVYSPIVHCHPIAIAHELPRDFAFWSEYNHLMILNSRGLAILMLDGWKESLGVTGEVEYCGALGKPIYFMLKLRNGKYALSPRDSSHPDAIASNPA
jgi:hypothetical protein